MAFQPVQIIWETHNEYIFRDIPSVWNPQIYQFVLDSLLASEIFQTCGLSKTEHLNDDFPILVKHILNDECSLVVCDGHPGQIYGVALCKWMTKEWRSWAMPRLLFEEGGIADYVELMSDLVKASRKNAPNIDSLHVFQYFIHDELRTDPEFMRKFFYSLCEIGRHMQMPRVTFTTMSNIEHAEAAKAGFKRISHLLYFLYKIHGEYVYTKLRDIDEMFIALWEKRVEPVTPFEAMVLRDSEAIVANQMQDPAARRSMLTQYTANLVLSESVRRFTKL